MFLCILCVLYCTLIFDIPSKHCFLTFIFFHGKTLPFFNINFIMCYDDEQKNEENK